MTIIPSNLDGAAAIAWTWAVSFFPRLAIAVVVLIAGWALAKWASRAVGAAIRETGGLDEAARPALASAARYAVLVLSIVAALSQLGVQTASLLAALGAAGLAIGLALQSTLSNIAAGMMILWLRPFGIGDYIEVVAGNVIAGRIEEIGLFACRLETFDGMYVFAPNSTIWNFAVRNHSRNLGRLVCFNVLLSPNADVQKASAVLLDVLRHRARERPSPEVFFDNLKDGAPLLTCRLWVERDRLGIVQRLILDEARRSLEETSPNLKPTQIARTVPPDSDPSRLV